MRKCFIAGTIALALGAGVSWAARPKASPAPKRLPALVGRSIQFDPGFGYYQHRSADSIAWEMKANGYNIVRYVITNDNDINDDLIRAFHRHGIAVWYQTGGNGFYTVGKPEPRDWKSWKMSFIGPYTEDAYKFMSMSNPGFIAWKRGKVVEVATHHAFDGVEIAEPFQMGWQGPEEGLYGDFSPSALKAFTAYSGYQDPPDFRDAASPRYFKTDTRRYAKWQDFRVYAVARFLDAIVNGPGGLRRKCPGMPFAAWALANTSPIPGRNPADLMREWQGIDAVAIARMVHPDQMVFQTNWPDWVTPELPGNYPLQYRAFTDPFRKAFPKTPFIVQADIGSNKAMRRSREWIAEFEKACKEIGASGSTAYMYDIALWMYTEPPQVRIAQAEGNHVLLVFQKCVSPKTAGDPARYRIVDPKGRVAKITKATVDGNVVRLTTGALRKGIVYTVSYTGVTDDPSRWMEKGGAVHASGQTLKVKAR